MPNTRIESCVDQVERNTAALEDAFESFRLEQATQQSEQDQHFTKLKSLLTSFLRGKSIALDDSKATQIPTIDTSLSPLLPQSSTPPSSTSITEKLRCHCSTGRSGGLDCSC